MAKQTICDNCGELVGLPMVDFELEGKNGIKKFRLEFVPQEAVGSVGHAKADLCLNCVKTGVAGGEVPAMPDASALTEVLEEALSRMHPLHKVVHHMGPFGRRP